MKVVKEALKQFSQAVIFQSKHLPRTCWPKRPAAVANIKKKKKKKNLCSFFLKRLELYTYFLRKQTNKRRTAFFPRVYALDFHLPLGWNLAFGGPVVQSSADSRYGKELVSYWVILEDFQQKIKVWFRGSFCDRISTSWNSGKLTDQNSFKFHISEPSGSGV